MGKGGQTLSATQFAQLTGVSRERLRTWERRYGFPAPVRQDGGPRRYRTEDVTKVVAVRRAADEGAPLAVAIAGARASVDEAAPPADAFEAAVELAPVPVALVSGPEPLRLVYANAELRGIAGAPAVGSELVGFLGLREHFTRDLPAADVVHTAWAAEEQATTSVVYRLPCRSGEAPLVALVGAASRGERAARAALAEQERRLAEVERRAARHDRWLDALAGLATEFQHEPGPDVVGSAIDVVVRQTQAVDGALASYLSGRLALRGSRRGVLGPQTLTVAAHPEVGRALRDREGVWLDPTVAALLGVPAGLHAAGIPVVVAGETLGLLVMLFDAVEPHDHDNRRLLVALSAALGFALLRDRLVREVRLAVSPARPTPPPAAAARSPAGSGARPASG